MDGAEHEAFNSNDREPIELVTFTDLIRAKREIGRTVRTRSNCWQWRQALLLLPIVGGKLAAAQSDKPADARSRSDGRHRVLRRHPRTSQDACAFCVLTPISQKKTKAGRLGNSFLRAEFDNDPTISELVAAVEHSGGSFEPKSNDPLVIYGALSRAVACGAIHAVHKLFNHVDLSVGQIYYLLALAVSLGEPRIVRHIIKSTRVDLDVRLTNQLHPDFIQTKGRTLLACAVYHRHSDVTQALLALGANPTIADDYNKTPLQYAAKDTDVYRAIIAGIARWGCRLTQMERR